MARKRAREIPLDNVMDEFDALMEQDTDDEDNDLDDLYGESDSDDGTVDEEARIEEEEEIRRTAPERRRKKQLTSKRRVNSIGGLCFYYWDMKYVCLLNQTFIFMTIFL